MDQLLKLTGLLKMLTLRPEIFMHTPWRHALMSHIVCILSSVSIRGKNPAVIQQLSGTVSEQDVSSRT